MSEPQKRSVTAWLAPLAPLVVFPCGGLALLANVESADVISTARTGPAGTVMIAVALSAIVLCALLALAARGRAIPGALVVAIAALPWILASIGARAAIASPPPDGDHVSATMMVMVSAIYARFVGAAFGAALLSGTALGLACAAWAQRPAERRAQLGAAIGVGSGLLLAGASSAAAITSEMPGGTAVAVSIAALPALALAGASMGTDARSSALATSAAVAAGLSVIAAAGVGDAAVRIETFQSMAFAGPDDRLRVYAGGLEEGRSLTLLASWGWTVALLSASAIAAWSFARARIDRGRSVGAFAMIAISTVAIAPSVGVLEGLDTLLMADLHERSDGEDFELADVDVRGVPVEPSIEVAITPSEILVDARAVDDVRQELEQHAGRLRLIAERVPTRPFDGRLLLLADRDVTYSRVARTLAAARAAGFVQPALVLRDASGERAAFELTTHADAVEPETMLVRVDVQSNGYYVRVGGLLVGPDGRPEPGRGAPSVSRGGEADPAGLTRCFAGIEVPEGAVVGSRIEAESSARWRDIAPVAAIVQSRFPSLILDDRPQGS